MIDELKKLVPENFTSIVLDFDVQTEEALLKFLPVCYRIASMSRGEVSAFRVKDRDDLVRVVMKLNPKPIQLQDTMETATHFLRCDANYPEGHEHQIRLVDLNIVSEFLNEIQSLAISGIAKAMDSNRSAIIGCYAEMNKVRIDLGRDIRSLKKEVASLKRQPGSD